ncbi:hypothetical protein K2173_021613 [Erythroxylum novogranatense]|uniref:Chlororespiratory reduction 4 n=1 Tax=Erythroxylum novogranatense TaxID=1862640 RepID=A0AAV8TNC7_9ROSI|nr:hypothetical protein K2173_021613 [Erythroxylum novogranatense]
MNLIKKCPSLRTLKSIHAHLLVSASIPSSDLALNKILRLYSRFGAICYAQKLFDQLPEPNSYLWSALVHGFVEGKRYEDALLIFIRMRRESVTPLNFTIASVLKALARLEKKKDGQVLQGSALKLGVGCDLIVQNAFIDLFMRCGEVDLARQLFEEMEERDVVTWNSMVFGYGNNGILDIALHFFNRMEERDVISWTSMIQGYVRAGDMVQARALFERMPTKDLTSWNVMVSSYLDAGDVASARHIVESMPICDVRIHNLMISGYCKAGNLQAAREFFESMPSKNVASWVLMMDGYIQVEDLDNARCLFDQMAEKNLVAWSTIIGGYSKIGKPHSALHLYKYFKEYGLKPDETFILIIISACSQLGILHIAESVIQEFEGFSLLSNLHIATSLIDMYAKCGSIERAVEVFEMVDRKDLLCYTTMITAFANHGLSQHAISFFYKMQKANIEPDALAFLGVLTACNHAGRANEGRIFFKQMKDEYGIQPSEKHYACVVDLLGRAGCLEEAHNLVNNMPMAPSPMVWGALLAACRVHRNVELAEVAATELFMIEPKNSGNYILLSNIYAAAGRWDDVGKLRTMIRDNRVRKNKGSSWVELESEVHEFVMGDKSHTDSESIYFVLYLLGEDMKLLG